MKNLIAEIHLNRLMENIDIVSDQLPLGIKVIGVVKADGYGHGAVSVARVLMESGITHFAVSEFEEAVALQEEGIRASVLILGDVDESVVEEVIAREVILSISDYERIKHVLEITSRLGKTARVHVKVDTGMGRFGFEPADVPKAMEQLTSESRVRVEGIYSHLSSTFLTDPASDEFTLAQINVFEKLLAALDEQRLLPELVHIGSSTALIGFPERVAGGYFNAVRIGTLFLGFEERPSDWIRHPTPVAEVKTRLVSVRRFPAGRAISYDRTFCTKRPSTIAVLPVGYAHGYHRDLSNQGLVEIGGERFPVCGKITLGQTMIDATGLKDLKPGQEVILAGKSISAYEQAKKIGRGTWEVLLPLLQRSDLHYLNDG